ncbi:hypothetical protein B0O80DRAFT_38462 [Mortierella sp. GBAus27b]|nr:hypothetical protein B0O80DRAFT_38462 [Mortierella sp. GBAus27b]
MHDQRRTKWPLLFLSFRTTPLPALTITARISLPQPQSRCCCHTATMSPSTVSSSTRSDSSTTSSASMPRYTPTTSLSSATSSSTLAFRHRSLTGRISFTSTMGFSATRYHLCQGHSTLLHPWSRPLVKGSRLLWSIFGSI